MTRVDFDVETSRRFLSNWRN